MEIEQETTESPSLKRNMDDIDNWTNRAKQIKGTYSDTFQNVPIQDMQESAYDASVFIHYNTDVVIGSLKGLYLSCTEIDNHEYRIITNGSGSGVDDVYIDTNRTQYDGIVKSHDTVCIRHKKSILYVSYDSSTRDVKLVRNAVSDNERWEIINDFIENADPNIESGREIVFRNRGNSFLIHNEKGLLQAPSYEGSTDVLEEQVWLILKSHCSFLTCTPTSMYDEEISDSIAYPSIDITSLPYQIQSIRITDEVRHALLLSPGDLLSFLTYPEPLLGNKPLLFGNLVDMSKAIDYLKLGFYINERYKMAASLNNTLQQMLPNLNQVISFKF